MQLVADQAKLRRRLRAQRQLVGVAEAAARVSAQLAALQWVVHALEQFGDFNAQRVTVLPGQRREALHMRMATVVVP